MSKRRKRRRNRPPAPPPADAASVAKPAAENADNAEQADASHPWLVAGVFALTIAQPLVPGETGAPMGHSLPLAMLWVVLAVLWFLAGLSKGTRTLRFGWIDAAVAALVVWHSLAAVSAAANASPRPAINMLWQWVGLGAAFFVIRQVVTGRREIRTLAVAMIAVAMVLSCYGMYQQFYDFSEARKEYAADPEGVLARLEIPPGSPAQKMYEARLATAEPMGTFALANSLAAFLTPWLVVLAGIGLTAGLRGESASRVWPAVAIAAVPIVACVALTKSISAYVALAAAAGVALAYWLLRRSGRRSWKIPLAAAGALAAGIALAMALSLHTVALKSLGYRFQYWQSTLRMIADDPLLGCGPGNFQNEYTRFKLPEASEEVAEPHNFLLEVWATAGTPAMLALVAVLVGFGYCVFLVPATREAAGSPDAECPDALMWGGAAAGVLLTYPVASLSGFPPSPEFLGATILLGAGCAALFHRWTANGMLPKSVIGLGVVAMLIVLLASGGIGFPSVAASLWVLLALGLNLADAESTQPGRTPRQLGPVGVLAGLGVGVVLAVAFYVSAYRPVLACRGAIEQAREDPQRAKELLHEAAEADPLDPEPWNKLAQVALADWRQTRDPDTLAALETYCEKELARAPNDSALWSEVGDGYLEVHGRTKERRELDRATACYRKAVGLYPNSAIGRAKLALAYLAAEDDPQFAEQAAEAIRLDETTPHADKKLDPAIRDKLANALSRKGLSRN